ncbi:unnamed protein product [Blepharisma stoltei]|uniref:Uncharacterized protein n=1 Tax=Blepharisma stoltei TaxID=1481888 RepID=A0AAU9IQA3_9CILI|nr:unnamed protein product [Blepharisma stoltei]
MHHLDELNRNRALNLYLLTPEDVVPPIQRTFVVTKHQYKSILEDNAFAPLLPSSQRVKNNSSPGQEEEKSREEMLSQRRRERLRSKSNKKRMIFKDGCPTCGQEHIPVEYFNHRHICSKCREYIKTPDGSPVKIVLDRGETILALAFDERKKLKPVDHQNLMIFDRPCFASFAGPGELVVLLYDEGLTY